MKNPTSANARSFSERAVRSAAFNSSSWVLVLLLNLLATPYLVRSLTPAVFGLMVIMNGILGYLTIVDFSFRDALIKYAAEHAAREEYPLVRGIFGTVATFQFALGAACSVALVASATSVLSWFHIPPELGLDARQGYLIMSLGFPLSLLNGLYTSLPVAMQRFDVAAAVSTASGCAIAAGSVALVAAGHGLPAIMGLNVLVMVGSCLWCHIWMRRNYVWWRFSPACDRSVLRRLFGFSFFSQLAKSASMVNDQFLRILIGGLLGVAAVTDYTVPLRLINGFQGIVDKVAKVFFPMASELAARRDSEALKRTYLAAARYICVAVTPVYFTLAIFSRDVLTVWMGAQFASRSWGVLCFSSLTYYLISWTMLPSNIAFGLGKAKINAVFAVAVAVANLILTCLLCRRFGINGAAGAILVTQIQTPCFVYIVSRDFGRDFAWRVLKDAYLKPSLLGLLIPVVALGFMQVLHSPVHRVLLAMPATAAIYLGAAIALRLVPREVISRLADSLWQRPRPA